MSTIKHSQISALLVDDDAKLCGLLRDYLEGFGFSLDVAEDASSGLEKAVANEYDVILLDMMLPDMDGLDVLRRLREIGSTPIVIFSAQDEEASRIVGLEMGADDYVPKAFSPRELLARVRAMLRRREQFTPDLLTFEDLTLNCSAYELGSTHGVLRLTNKEFQIMELLMRSPHHIFSSEQLMERIWGWDSDTEINVVWTNIAYLRRKMTRLKVRAEIRSVRGAGYMLEAIPC